MCTPTARSPRANRLLAVYFSFYNRIRPHQNPQRITPDAAYFGTIPMRAAA